MLVTFKSITPMEALISADHKYLILRSFKGDDGEDVFYVSIMNGKYDDYRIGQSEFELLAKCIKAIERNRE